MNLPVELPQPRVTRIEVVYPADKGRIGLRGSHAPLSWDHTEAPTRVEGDRHVFEVRVPRDELLELKLVRNDDDWAGGRNYVVHPGDDLVLEPYFDTAVGTLEPLASVEHAGLRLDFEVFLPPSYREQPQRRYPVLYAMDGQSLWSTSKDPFGVWRLDEELNRLYELAAIEQLIVVGVHASDDRLNRLTPLPDPQDGGGQGEKTLAAIVEALVPHVNATYRTRANRMDTALLGSSLGGLFSFYAAWTRPEVFGKAACLSSSFWWANRWAVRAVQQGAVPSPRPMLYLDSGAALNPHERNMNLRDGFHHTRSMFRALTSAGFQPGVDLHRLVFAGASHDAGSWSQRVGLPLQLLFPADGSVATS